MYSYLYILLASIVVPLFLSFEKRVRYVSQWSAVIKTTVIVAIPFWIWDVIFTHQGIWGFNESHTIGIEAFGLPIEELLFFIAIPFSTMIFWEISQAYKFYRFFKTYKIFFNFLSIISIFLLLYFLSKPYTLIVMIATLCTTYLVSKQSVSFNKNIVFLFFISLPFFFIVNGLLTSIPIVWYNLADKSGLMIGSIPLEDLFFSYSLLSANAYIYEKIKARHTA